MAKAICIIGESGAGKTTSLRNLDPKETYYIDADKKEVHGEASDNSIMQITKTTLLQMILIKY